ncbi:hypothetical protein OQA88_5168 [Cercophora sp. LCS_1]
MRLLAVLVYVTWTTAQQNGCYYPNGEPSSDIPCDSVAPVSMCCGSRLGCLSSGLCLLDGTSETRGISYARGTCTDPTWKSPHCPQHCQLSQETALNASAYDFRAGGVQVWECVGEGYAEPAAYCCESVAEKTRCCQTPEAVFSLPGATVGNAEAVQTWSGSATVSSGTTKTTKTTGTSAGSSSETGTTAGGGTTAVTTAATGDGSRSTNSLQENDGGGGLSREATLGIAITLSLVGAALIAMAFFLWYRRSKPAVAGEAHSEGWNKPELDANGVPIAMPVTELDSRNEVKELGPGTMIVEAQAGEYGPVEIDTRGYQAGYHGQQPVEMYAGTQR